MMQSAGVQDHKMLENSRYCYNYAVERDGKKRDWIR